MQRRPRTPPPPKPPPKTRFSLAERGEQRTKEMQRFDADGDGQIDLQEFLAEGGTAAGFAVLDADGSGFITQEELDIATASGALAEHVGTE